MGAFNGFFPNIDVYLVLFLVCFTVVMAFVTYLLLEEVKRRPAQRGVAFLDATLKALRSQSLKPEFKNDKELAGIISRVDIASTEARALLRRNDYRAAEKIIDDISAELAKRAELISSL
ncbi:MAG: hypothetical protein WC028_25680 [Candidatus Obscuribacterales bacterium]